MSEFIKNFSLDEYLNKIKHIFVDEKYFDEKIKDISKIEVLFNQLNKNFEDLGSDSKHLNAFYSLEDEKSDSGYYRPQSQDLNKNYELIFSGCSQTTSEFICPPFYLSGDHNNIWGFQVANYFKKDALNLGTSGYGISQIVRRIFHQIFKNGNPKAILILFPDYGRLAMPHTKNLKGMNSNNKDFIQTYYLSGVQIEKTIDKSPYLVENIVDSTVPLFYNLQSVLLLEKYCIKNNIYFKYSSWHGATNILFELLKENTNDYQNYIDIDSNVWLDSSEDSLFNECHLDIKEKAGSVFDIASDGIHMGVHRNCHIAEEFIERMKNDNTWN